MDGSTGTGFGGKKGCDEMTVSLMMLAAMLGVYADPGSSAETKAVRDRLANGTAPLLQALQSVGSAERPKVLSALEAAPAKLPDWMVQADEHLVIVGTPAEGPIAKLVKGYTYGLDCEKKGFYRLGLGRFKGDVGIVETAFNPWLYSDKVNDTEKSTLMIRISGTTPKGVQLAAKAFESGMINGAVLGEGAQRTETSILDLEVSAEPPPAELTSRFDGAAGLTYAGWTQCPAQEYRAYLDWGAQHEPRRVWRLKYLAADSLDSASGVTWANSPLPMAFGNAVTIAAFDAASDAAAVRAAIVAKYGSATLPYPTDEVDYGAGEIIVSVIGSNLIFDARRSK